MTKHETAIVIDQARVDHALGLYREFKIMMLQIPALEDALSNAVNAFMNDAEFLLFIHGCGRVDEELEGDDVL